MGKVPNNGFCYISVNKILKMTSQYNNSLGSLQNYFFSGIFRVAVALTPFALQSAPTSDSYQLKLTQLVVMSCLQALFPTLYLLTALFSFHQNDVKLSNV